MFIGAFFAESAHRVVLSFWKKSLDFYHSRGEPCHIRV